MESTLDALSKLVADASHISFWTIILGLTEVDMFSESSIGIESTPSLEWHTTIL